MKKMPLPKIQGDVFLCILLVPVLVHAQQFSDVRDITTIYSLKANSTLEAGKVAVSGIERGIPLRRGKDILDVTRPDSCCVGWEMDGWRELSVSEALATNPVLSPTVQLGTLGRREHMKQTDTGCWRGFLSPGREVLVDWTPAAGQATSFLGVLLCNTRLQEDCYGLTLAGSAGSSVRYYWIHYTTPASDKAVRWTPCSGRTGLAASKVLDRNETVRESWEPGQSHLLLEMVQDRHNLSLSVRIPSTGWRRQFPLPPLYKYLFIDRYNQRGKVHVQDDPAWQGALVRPSELQIAFTPIGAGKAAQLGVFFCTNISQVDCHGIVVYGADSLSLSATYAKYDTSPTEVKMVHQFDTIQTNLLSVEAAAWPEEAAGWTPAQLGSRRRLFRTRTVLTNRRIPGGWEIRQVNLTLRLENSKVIIDQGDITDVWSLPLGPEFNYVIVEVSGNLSGHLHVQGKLLSPQVTPVAWPVLSLEGGRKRGLLVSPVLGMPDAALRMLLIARVPVKGSLSLAISEPSVNFTQSVLHIPTGKSDGNWMVVSKELRVEKHAQQLLQNGTGVRLVLEVSMLTADTNVYVQLLDVYRVQNDQTFDISPFVIKSVPRDQAFGFDLASAGAVRQFQGDNGTCEHDGKFDASAKRCRCLPGFTGKTCEEGCGSKLLGETCKLQCNTFSSRDCANLLVCGPGLPCTCAPGYEGEPCDQPCRDGKYGPDCRFSCGECADDEPCNIYTGRCPRDKCGGSGLKPPLCHKLSETPLTSRPEFVGTLCGLLIIGLLAVIAFVVWRRRAGQRNKTRGKGSFRLLKKKPERNSTTNSYVMGTERKADTLGRSQGDREWINPPSPNDRWQFPRDRLQVFEILGEGCFGLVRRGEAIDIDGKDGRMTVAVKTLREKAGATEREDLLQEIAVMKTLAPHPNVVRMLACCSEADPVYLIMEFAARGKLQTLLRDFREQESSVRVTSRDLVSYTYQVAKGMEYLSTKGIIHRDLAARNILVGEDLTCKVADFGFARDLEHNHVYERTSDGRLPIRWMAPESLYDNVFSVKSDVWSFGVFMWEVVTLGSTPYPGLSSAEVMRRVREGHRLEMPHHCRRELYNLMFYCWHRDPAERPDFGELVERAEELLLSETDYIKLGDFPENSYYNMTSQSGEKL